MPRIINAYSDNDSLGNAFAKMADAIYGDGAKNEVYRQKAIETKRGNDNAENFAAAVRDGDRKNIGYYGALGNHTGQDTGDFGRYSASVAAGGNVDDPRLATAFMGAGGNFSATAPGQGRSLANDRSIAGGHDATTLAAEDMRSKRAAETQLAIDARTLTPVVDENGVPHYQQKSHAVGGEAPQTTDGVIANVIRKQAARAGQPGESTSDPLGGLDPRILKKANLDLPEQTLVHPTTGASGISRDGGRTVILQDGSRVPATGYMPVSQETALNEARGAAARAQTAQPLVVGDPAKSQAAADAAQTSGIPAKIAKKANEELGAIGAGPIIQAVTGSPEISPATQRAQSQQDIRNNQARAVLLGGPGRQTVQAQKWVNELIPQGDALANPATEAAKIPTIVNALKGDHEQYRQIVQTTHDPAERSKALVAMHQIENTIRMYTEPQQPAAPAAQAAAPATPTAGAPVPNDALAQARQAIAAGANPAAVRQRLQQHGIDPSGLDGGAPAVPVSQ